MSIYRDLLKSDSETTSQGIITGLRGEIEKIAGFIDHQRNKGKKSFLFAATERGEGNTLILIQTAILLSQLNSTKKVLIVDANLRFPAVHTFLGVTVGHGLLDFLKDPESDLPYQKQTNNLDVVVAGIKEETRFEKSGLGNLNRLVESAVKEYDHILIDSPAVRNFADALVIAPVVDGVILTVAAGLSSKGIVKTAIKSLTNAGGDVVGTVFNRRKDEIPSFIYRWL